MTDSAARNFTGRRSESNAALWKRTAPKRYNVNEAHNEIVRKNWHIKHGIFFVLYRQWIHHSTNKITRQQTHNYADVSVFLLKLQDWPSVCLSTDQVIKNPNPTFLCSFRAYSLTDVYYCTNICTNRCKIKTKFYKKHFNPLKTKRRPFYLTFRHRASCI